MSESRTRKQGRVIPRDDQRIAISDGHLPRRTLLTSVRGVIGPIGMIHAGEVSHQVVEMLKVAERNSVQLKRSIDVILDMQEVESGTMREKMIEDGDPRGDGNDRRTGGIDNEAG